MRDLHPFLRGRGAEGYVRSGFGGLGLPDDGRHRRRHRLGLFHGRRFHAALLPGIPPLARGALLVGGQLRAVLVADEARTRAARPIRAAFHAAAHVQGPAWAGRLRRDPDDALSGHRRRQLALRLEPAVPLEDALLLGGGKLLGVILAEPPVARAGTRLAAARHRTEPAGEPPIRAPTRTAPGAWDARQGQRDLLLDVLGDGCSQLAREAIDQRAERSFLCSIGLWRFSDSDNGAVTALHGRVGSIRWRRIKRAKNALLAEQPFELVPRLFLELLLLRLRLRLRSLLRLLLDLLRLLFRRLLRPPGVDSQRASYQRGSSLLQDLIYRRLEVEIHHRWAPRRAHQPELHRDGIGRHHLATGDRRDGAGRERDHAGQVEGAVDAQSSGEHHLRLRARDLEGLLQPGDALLDGDAEGKILAQAGLASLSRLACEPEWKRLRQRTSHRRDDVLSQEGAVEHVALEDAC